MEERQIHAVMGNGVNIGFRIATPQQETVCNDQIFRSCKCTVSKASEYKLLHFSSDDQVAAAQEGCIDGGGGGRRSSGPTEWLNVINERSKGLLAATAVE